MEEIKKRNISAIIGPTMTFRSKVKTRGKNFRTVGRFAEEGKDADVVIFDGNPLEVMTRTRVVIVNGKIAYREGK